MVSDSGAGIPGGYAEKLFNTDNNVSTQGLMQEKGSGLGLKLCKEFVELNGGTIWLTSETGEGAHFFFTVPTTNFLHPFGEINLKSRLKCEI
jgi:signal transduction histidine kinase